MPGAELGVDGFFALSGFLITTLLLQEWRQNGTISLKRFYIRRALRLLPALYAMLAAVCIFTAIALVGEGAVATWRGVLLASLYSTNLVTLFFQDYWIGTGLVNHTWSLALEEQFYLLWPILLVGLLTLGLRGKRLAICVGAFVLAMPLYRILLLGGIEDPKLFALGIFTRADALLMGCTLGALAVGGFVMPSMRLARITRWIAVVGTVILGYFTLTGLQLEKAYGFYWIYPLIGVSVCAVLLHLLIAPQGRLAQALSWKPLAQLGVISYGVYLWHMPVFQVLRPGPAGWLDWPVELTRLAITAVLVAASYRYIEQPMLRLKERFAGKPEIRVEPAVGVLVAQSESA
jgi:peptidoglycan/LPS O-acetylase OafA/YrhL